MKKTLFIFCVLLFSKFSISQGNFNFSCDANTGVLLNIKSNKNSSFNIFSSSPLAFNANLNVSYLLKEIELGYFTIGYNHLNNVSTKVENIKMINPQTNMLEDFEYTSNLNLSNLIFGIGKSFRLANNLSSSFNINLIYHIDNSIYGILEKLEDQSRRTINSKFDKTNFQLSTNLQYNFYKGIRLNVAYTYSIKPYSLDALFSKYRISQLNIGLGYKF